jgi:hypothetical protein
MGEGGGEGTSWTSRRTPERFSGTDELCRHELSLGTCSVYKYDDRPAVYTTAGGSHYHRRPDCSALLDGQRRVEAAGGTTEPIEMVHRGSARLEGRDRCLRCAPG